MNNSLITSYPKHPSDFQIQNPPASVLIIGTCNTDSIYFGSKSVFVRTNQMIWDSYIHNEIPKIEELSFNPDVIYIQFSLRQIIDSMPKQSDRLFGWIDSPEIYFPAIGEALLTLLEKFHAYEKKGLVIFGSFLEPTLSLDGPNKPLFQPDSLNSRIRTLNAQYLQWCSDNNFAFLDVNDVANWIGRRHTLDDLSNGLMHSSTLADDEYSGLTKRFVTSRQLTEQYDAYPRILEYGVINAQRMMQLYKARMVFQPVKLIILDLDETLWRGIHSEDDLSVTERTEGWPLGMIEALLLFKRSGGILAIASKNSEIETLLAFEKIWKGKISITDFVSVKINHEPKNVNISQILGETGILPINALFIDDNPREIDSIKQTFPEMRILNTEHYDWRRTILQNIEFFMNKTTDESRRRTELLQNKIQRDKSIVDYSHRKDWLKSLSMKSKITKLESESDPNFERILELINKTNQFNLNGDRVLRETLLEEIKTSDIYYFTLSDRISDNGIVAVLSISKNLIKRFVISCRVFGLDFEFEILRKILQMENLDLMEIHFDFKETNRNAATQLFLGRIYKSGFQSHEVGEILTFESN